MPRPLALVALFLAAVFVQREFTLFRSLITGQPFPRLDALLGCALKLSLHLNPDPTGFSKQDAGLIDFYRYTATMGQARLEQLLATHRDVTDPTTLRVNANTSVLVMHKPHVTGRTKVCVYFHGGGTVVGSADDFFFRDLSRHTLVFSVAYPLAPTNPYPQGLDGAYAALVYAYEHASELGGDASTLTVAGTSAGGLIAAAVTLKAMRLNYPPIQHQVLVVPMLAPMSASASYLRAWDDHLLTAKLMSWFWSMYCVDVTVFECIKDPLCSPLAETRFAGMPRTDLFVSEHDVLRDEGVAYHRALQRGGVNSTLRFLKGSHFFVLSQMDEISHAFVD